MSRPRRRLRLAIAAAALAATLVASASAELTQRGDLFVRFDGGISPRALPRSAPAPIAVRIEGALRVLDGRRPPALKQIQIALNRAGHLSSRGLPICRRSQIDPATSAEALARCGAALLGAGGIVAGSTLPEQLSAVYRADVLLFNSLARGRRVILAHVFQREPPTTSFIVFKIHHTAGTFGTVLTGRVPARLNRHAYLKSIFLQLERRYVFRGQLRSYLSAACATPPGVPVASFPFARASLTFADGRTLASTLTRSCRVRG